MVHGSSLYYSMLLCFKFSILIKIVTFLLLVLKRGFIRVTVNLTYLTMTTRLTSRKHLGKCSLSQDGFCSSAPRGRQGRAEGGVVDLKEITLFNAVLQHL